MIELYRHQVDAVRKMRNGCILCGGVGSGKSRTSLTYYYTKVCGGELCINGFGETHPMRVPRPLYIITTARKRDELEWEEEMLPFGLSTHTDSSNAPAVVDSWNNIKKYTDVTDSFFIFDEQRVIGSGAWTKSFLKIVKRNRWILLSATPGDTYADYIPVFIANGFYKNRTEFILRHVVYSRFSKFPKVERYLETGYLERLKRQIIVPMPYPTRAEKVVQRVECTYQKRDYMRVLKDRWNIFKELPIKNAGELCYTLRRVVNEDGDRFDQLFAILSKHPRVILFYNFDYELKRLKEIFCEFGVVKEWNGHVHDPIPEEDRWLYLVQYTAGAEGWNCIKTNAIVFFSLNYSYKVMLQSAGRIDRLNTPYDKLYYYILYSNSSIDSAILKALREKRNFNQKSFENEKNSKN